MWLYGCLTEDTEILTEDGWKRGIDVQVGERVAQWDEGRIEVAPVLAKVIAPYVGPLIRLVNHDTDQLLTPNHRVYHRAKERVQRRGIRRAEWSGWRVLEASALLGWQAIRLPLAGVHDGDGIGGPEYAALLGWVWTEGGFDRPPSTGVRIYQSSTNAGRVAEIAALLDRLVPSHKRYDRKRTWRGRAYTETCWFFTGPMAARVRADLPGKHPGYALIWRMTLAEKRVFWLAAMAGDGSGYQFYQRDRVDLEWAQALLASMGQRGRLTMRSNRRGGAVTVTPRPETELQARHLRRRHVEYDGRVWCVRVPSGAFVARRNGQVFVTGNSGFPKSLDVSKAIDKAAGMERDVVDPPPYTRGRARQSYSETRRVSYDYNPQPITDPATEAAKQWSGWGTALKPAWEPILLCRKPLSEPTVAANVLKHGTGAINVDGCRIGTAEQLQGSSVRNDIRGGKFAAGHRPNPGDIEPYQQSPLGRWPANVVLDEQAAALLDEQSGESQSRVGKPRVAAPGTGWGMTATGTEHQDRGGASRFFKVVKWQEDDEIPTSPASNAGNPSTLSNPSDASARSPAQTAFAQTDPSAIRGQGSIGRSEPSIPMVNHAPNAAHQGDTDTTPTTPTCCASCGSVLHATDAPISQADAAAGAGVNVQGGGMRFRYDAKAEREDRDGSKHPTIKPVDLCKWLVRLVTPPGGLVLDPFMGSGPIVWAARELGFRAVGVDREAEYVQDAVRRLQQQILWDAAAPARPVEGVDLPEPEQLRLDGEAT